MFHIYRYVVLCSVMFLVFGITDAWSQGRSIGLRIQGDYFQPIGAFKDRVDAAPGGGAGLTVELNQKIDLEIRAFYSKFTGAKTSIINFDDQFEDIPDVDVEFSMVGLTCSGIFKLMQPSTVQPYLVGGGGLYRWKHHRTETEVSDTTVEELVRQAYSLGINLGAGLNFSISPKMLLSLDARYEMILDSLWPTFTLEYVSVNPIHFLTIEGGLRFQF